MKQQTKYYKVAGLAFGVEVGDGIELEGRLGAYEPFEVEKPEDLLFLMPIEISNGNMPLEEGWRKAINSEAEGFVEQLYADDKNGYHYVVKLDRKPGMWVCVDFNRDMTEAGCRVCGDEAFQLLALNNALMLMFALCGASHDVLLFHSSVIMHQGKGYMFLGKSGTGKSTHSQLWMKYIGGCELLNDDNPAVRVIDGRPWVFGTPWSGKTPCYKNKQVPVGGIVRLWQAPVNEIQRLGTLQAYAALLPTVSSMRWESWCADYVNATLNSLIQAVPVFSLKNRPEEAAARMSFNALTQEDGRDK